jgi:hypothetical protein
MFRSITLSMSDATRFNTPSKQLGRTSCADGVTVSSVAALRTFLHNAHYDVSNI